MVLTTGNKSEMSVGYATLYGDMCGGYNVLKDVYKMEVFRSRAGATSMRRTARWGLRAASSRKHHRAPPSAELRADQTDQDSLPPYEILDGILECLVEMRCRSKTVARRAMSPRPSSASSICSTSPNTNAARRRPA
jgi:NAD+ synthase